MPEATPVQPLAVLTSPPSPTLYHQQFWSSSRPYALLLELASAAASVAVVPVTTAQLKNDAFLTSINPARRLPLFHDPAADVTMSESGGVCAYILEIYDAAGALAPPPAARATFLELFHFGPATLYHVVVPMFFKKFYGDKTPEGGVTGLTVSDAEFKKNEKLWREIGAPTLVRALKRHGGPWMCGDKFTAVDAMLAYDVMTISFVGDESLIADFPELKAWFDKVKERKSFKTLYTPPEA